MIVALIVSIYGLIFLIRGKGVGKDAVAHSQYRWLGGFLLTFVPVQMVLALLWGIILAISNPNMTEEMAKDRFTTPSLIIGFGLLVTYLVIATLWEKAIKRRVAASSPTSWPARG
ncbi:MAG TPA: hypothetical protein VFF65_14090 [Phycisphaerales bacterium]|nr:hypothetical protein [Phycisphaerales bacterium]